MKPAPLTLEISCCSSMLRVYGKRSSSWHLYRFAGKAAEPVLVMPGIEGKDLAIRHGLDCCAEEPFSVFILKPSPKAS